MECYIDRLRHIFANSKDNEKDSYYFWFIMILRSDQFCKDFKLEFSIKSMNKILHMQTENGWKREFHILKTEYDETRQPINISGFQWIQSFQRQKNHLENIFHNPYKMIFFAKRSS